MSAAAPLLFQGGEVEGTPAYERLKLMAQYYWEVRCCKMVSLLGNFSPDRSLACLAAGLDWCKFQFAVGTSMSVLTCPSTVPYYRNADPGRKPVPRTGARPTSDTSPNPTEHSSGQRHYPMQVGVMFWSDRNGVLRVLLEDWEEQLIGERGPPDRQTWRNAAVRPLPHIRSCVVCTFDRLLRRCLC